MAFNTYDLLFNRAGEKYGINPRILKAIAIIESGLNPKAMGDSGQSIGLMQVSKGTWANYETKTGMQWEDLISPYKNILAGAMIYSDKSKSINTLYPSAPKKEQFERTVIFYNGHKGKYTDGGKAYLARFYKSFNNLPFNLNTPTTATINPSIVITAGLIILFILIDRKR